MFEGSQSLSDTERRLREQMPQLTLLGQLPQGEQDFPLLLRLIKDATRRDFARIREHYQLSFACFLVWVGVKYYDHGTYWARVEDYLGQSGGNRQQLWGETFLEALRRYRLTVFPQARARKYVDPILLHGGIPDVYLRNFFEQVLYAIVNNHLDTELGAPEQIIAEWRATYHYQQARKPVQHFLEEGGKPAADLLGRCLEMARAAYCGEPLPSASELGLPERVVQQFEQWWRGFQQPLLPEQKLALRRPQLARDAYGGVRCLLPEQAIPANRPATLLFQVSADGADVWAEELSCYPAAQQLVTERAECELPPARSYTVQLRQDAHPLREWSFAGLTAEGWLAFDEAGELLNSDQLPRDCFWLVFPQEMKLGDGARVVEETPGDGAWTQYRHCLIDASAVTELTLGTADGRQIALPLAVGNVPTLDSAPLPGCQVNGAPVYTTQLPSVHVPLTEEQESNRWNVIVEGVGLPRKCVTLREVVSRVEDGCLVVPLAQPALLGEPQCGEYRVKLRAQDALGCDQQFQFAYVRDLSYEFAQPFYLAHEAPRLTLLIDSRCRLRAADAASELRQQDEIVEITAITRSRFLTANLQDSSDHMLPLTFIVPRLRWTLRGLANHLMPGWLAAPLVAQREDFEASREITLIVQLPTAGRVDCAVMLEGAEQRSTARARNGEVRFSLSPFLDSLLNRGAPLARFVFTFTDPARGQQSFSPLLVRTRWLVERFECRETRRVAFSGLPVRQRREERVVTFALTDNGRYQNRRLRVWNLLQPWQTPLECDVPDSAATVEISEPISALPASKYRVELFTAGEFDAAAPLLPPRRNELDVFDITLGEGELLRRVLTQPTSFRQHLSRRLAGHKGSFELSRYTLTESDVDDLARVLIFLIEEGRAEEIKRLWFEDLSRQCRELELRRATRERLEHYAKAADDQARAQMLTLCKVIGLAVHSLLPLQMNTPVRHQNKLATYRGVYKWEYHDDTDGQRPTDLLGLEFAHLSRKIPLAQLDDLTPVLI